MWAATASIVAFTDPHAEGVVILFFAMLFLSLFLTLSLLLANSRRGLIASTALVFFVFLRYLGLGNWFNLVLIIASAFSFEIFLRRKS